MQVLDIGAVNTAERGDTVDIRVNGFIDELQRMAATVEGALEISEFDAHHAADADVGGQLEELAAVGLALFHIAGEVVPVFGRANQIG